MRLKLLALVLAVAAPFAISDGNSPVEAVPGQTTRVSVPNLADQGTLGTEANSYSGLPDISADGRFVAFESNASNLVVGDGNGFDDIFVHDRVTGATDRVNVSTGGAEANGGTIGARISGDGRYVAFTSEATNLVTGDSNSRADVFVRDRQTGVTERVSVDSAGGEGNESSILTDLTPDGRFIVFSSWASNLVPGDTHVCQEYFEFEIIYYNCSDVFIKDRLTSVTERVSVNSAGQQGTDGSSGGSVSDDARFIVFYGGTGIGPGGAAGTVIRDRVLGTTMDMAPPEATVMSGDGGSIVFHTTAALVPDDTNVCPYLPCYDSYVYSRASGSYERVSVDSSGNQGDDETRSSDISGNGRFVAFMSKSSNLVPGDTNFREDIFLRDRAVGLTRRVNLASSGAQTNDVTWHPNISDDGRFVAFTSWASNLIASDTNGMRDVFVHEVSFPDTDGDGVTDEGDNCPLIGNASQTEGDGDGVGTACDNCPDTSNPAQTNTDGDGRGDACDSDDDNDLVPDIDEPPCGGDPLDVTPPLSRPERLDLPGDDDGDTIPDEPLPAGADGFDCDGDGYIGSVEALVFSDTNARDQDSCGTNGWPSDLAGADNQITLADVTSFAAPAPRKLNTSPGAPGFNARWDLVPGQAGAGNWIALIDVTSLVVGPLAFPPMLGGVRAFNGPACPWAP